MSNGFFVNPADLATASSALNTASGEVASAVSAGAQVTSMSPQAFGIICSFFTPPCLAFSTTALSALGEIEKGLTKRAGSVDMCSDDFQNTDAQVAARHSSMMGAI